jgi:peptide/nickel transport system permease protein
MLSALRRYIRRNPNLGIGLALLGLLLAFSLIGPMFVDTSNADPLSVEPERPPSMEYPFGTDSQGRDLLAVMVAGTPLTLRIGLIAGFLGVAVGTVLAFMGAYYGGAVDTVIKSVVDISLTIPGLLVLIIVAVFLREGLSVNQMALIVALLAWRWPARTIRAQVLTMRERSWVQVARLSGMGGHKIIFLEMIPNLMPFLAAALVGAVASAILASIGLEALGLGPLDSPTLGMTIYWVIFYAALLHGFWWWWLPPIAIITILFVGLFNLAGGLDEIANPRLRKSV